MWEEDLPCYLPIFGGHTPGHASPSSTPPLPPCFPLSLQPCPFLHHTNTGLHWIHCTLHYYLVSHSQPLPGTCDKKVDNDTQGHTSLGFCLQVVS